MNFFRYGNFPRYHFDDTAAGTGGASPSPGAAPASPSAPAAAPSSTSPPAGGAAPGSDPSPATPAAGDPFAGMDGNFDQDLDEVILADDTSTDDGSQPTPAAPAAPAVPPAAQPAPAAAPSETPPAAQPAAEPAPTSPTSPRAALDQAVDGFKANQEDLAKWAGENLFKLSDEDVAALTTDASSVIPQIMGRVYTQALAAAGNLLRNFAPAMIEHAIEQQHTSRTKSQEAVSEFYGSNPDLNEKDHGALVNQWAKSFRAANPKATRKEAIEFVARAVRIQAGVAPPTGTPTARPATPFAPARPGGRPPVATNGEKDPYSGLGTDFDEN